MARSLNRVQIIGHLGSDPEVRQTAGGKQVASFSVATSETWTDGSGARKERTEWHRVVLWEPLAQLAAQYLKKGRQVFIEGKIQTRSWEDRGGQRRHTTEVVARDLIFLGDGRGGGKRGSGQHGRREPTPQAQGYGPPV